MERQPEPRTTYEPQEINDAEWRNPANWWGFSKRDTRTWVSKPFPAMGWTLNHRTRAVAAWLVGLLVRIPIFLVIGMGLRLGR